VALPIVLYRTGQGRGQRHGLAAGRMLAQPQKNARPALRQL